MMKPLVLFTLFHRDKTDPISNKLINPDTVLFFDMDGTLIYSDYANYLAYKEAYEKVLRRNLNINYLPTQRLDRNALREYNSKMSESQLKKIVYEKERCYNSYLMKNKVNKNLVNVLYEVSGKNKIFLVTNGREDRVKMTLDHFSLSNLFTDILTKDDTERAGETNKYKVAISKWNVSPETVVAYENEDIEIENANKTGINNIIKIKYYENIYNLSMPRYYNKKSLFEF